MQKIYEKGVLIMRNKSYIFCFILFTILFVAAYVAGRFVVTDDEKETGISNKANAEVIKETEYITKTNNNDTSGYWIKAEGDYIVIYNGNGTVITNTEISIENFEDREKQILREGIYVETADSLFRYLESYTS